MEKRIFIEWENGGWLNTIGQTEFQKVLNEMVKQYGPPTLVEYRDENEKWITDEPDKETE